MKSSNRLIVEDVGRQYDELISAPGHAYVQSVRKVMLRRLLENASGRYLDAGSGTGNNLDVFPARGLAFGVDLSASALRQSLTKHPTVPVVNATVTNLPFNDASFDVIAAIGILHHVHRSTTTILSEFSRLLRPGGLVVIDEPNGCNPAWWLFMAVKEIDRGDVWPITPGRLRREVLETDLEIREDKLWGFAMNNQRLLPLLVRMTPIVEQSPLRSVLCIRYWLVCRKSASSRNNEVIR